ncbi:hypothetical protein AX17_000671 [Amanita inopinata Kibby_2008]|nr:hypothetical protein AX17_000671 [Amanita inopinata Kibby_2008]
MNSSLRRLGALLPVDPAHPAQIALRTYALALSFSLGPSLIPLITALITNGNLSSKKLSNLGRVLKRELSHDGFASAITLAVGGGAAIRHLWCSQGYASRNNGTSNKQPPVSSPTWSLLEAQVTPPKLSPAQKTFISNLLSSVACLLLLHPGKRRSPRWRHFGPPATNSEIRSTLSLDLTILLFVRAMDAALQSLLSAPRVSERVHAQTHPDMLAHSDLVQSDLLSEKKQTASRNKRGLSSRIDAFIFWACSARHVCYFGFV